MSIPVLFVGGSLDGQRRVLESLAHVIRVPKLSKCGFGYEEYCRQTIFTLVHDNSCPAIYLSGSEPAENLIPILIHGYRNPAKDILSKICDKIHEFKRFRAHPSTICLSNRHLDDIKNSRQFHSYVGTKDGQIKTICGLNIEINDDLIEVEVK